MSALLAKSQITITDSVLRSKKHLMFVVPAKLRNTTLQLAISITKHFALLVKKLLTNAMHARNI